MKWICFSAIIWSKSFCRGSSWSYFWKFYWFWGHSWTRGTQLNVKNIISKYQSLLSKRFNNFSEKPWISANSISFWVVEIYSSSKIMIQNPIRNCSDHSGFHWKNKGLGKEESIKERGLVKQKSNGGQRLKGV